MLYSSIGSPMSNTTTPSNLRHIHSSNNMYISTHHDISTSTPTSIRSRPDSPSVQALRAIIRSDDSPNHRRGRTYSAQSPFVSPVSSSTLSSSVQRSYQDSQHQRHLSNDISSPIQSSSRRTRYNRRQRASTYSDFPTSTALSSHSRTHTHENHFSSTQPFRSKENNYTYAKYDSIKRENDTGTVPTGNDSLRSSMQTNNITTPPPIPNDSLRSSMQTSNITTPPPIPNDSLHSTKQTNNSTSSLVENDSLYSTQRTKDMRTPPPTILSPLRNNVWRSSQDTNQNDNTLNYHSTQQTKMVGASFKADISKDEVGTAEKISATHTIPNSPTTNVSSDQAEKYIPSDTSSKRDNTVHNEGVRTQGTANTRIDRSTSNNIPVPATNVTETNATYTIVTESNTTDTNVTESNTTDTNVTETNVKDGSVHGTVSSWSSHDRTKDLIELAATDLETDFMFNSTDVAAKQQAHTTMSQQTNERKKRTPQLMEARWREILQNQYTLEGERVRDLMSSRLSMATNELKEMQLRPTTMKGQTGMENGHYINELYPSKIDIPEGLTAKQRVLYENSQHNSTVSGMKRISMKQPTSHTRRPLYIDNHTTGCLEISKADQEGTTTNSVLCSTSNIPQSSVSHVANDSTPLESIGNKELSELNRSHVANDSMPLESIGNKDSSELNRSHGGDINTYTTNPYNLSVEVTTSSTFMATPTIQHSDTYYFNPKSINTDIYADSPNKLPQDSTSAIHPVYDSNTATTSLTSLNISSPLTDSIHENKMQTSTTNLPTSADLLTYYGSDIDSEDSDAELGHYHRMLQQAAILHHSSTILQNNHSESNMTEDFPQSLSEQSFDYDSRSRPPSPVIDGTSSSPFHSPCLTSPKNQIRPHTTTKRNTYIITDSILKKSSKDVHFDPRAQYDDLSTALTPEQVMLFHKTLQPHKSDDHLVHARAQTLAAMQNSQHSQNIRSPLNSSKDIPKNARRKHNMRAQLFGLQPTKRLVNNTENNNDNVPQYHKIGDIRPPRASERQRYGIPHRAMNPDSNVSRSTTMTTNEIDQEGLNALDGVGIFLPGFLPRKDEDFFDSGEGQLGELLEMEWQKSHHNSSS